jgi:hypothetical protein
MLALQCPLWCEHRPAIVGGVGVFASWLAGSWFANAPFVSERKGLPYLKGQVHESSAASHGIPVKISMRRHAYSAHRSIEELAAQSHISERTWPVEMSQHSPAGFIQQGSSKAVEVKGQWSYHSENLHSIHCGPYFFWKVASPRNQDDEMQVTCHCWV